MKGSSCQRSGRHIDELRWLSNFTSPPTVSGLRVPVVGHHVTVWVGGWVAAAHSTRRHSAGSLQQPRSTAVERGRRRRLRRQPPHPHTRRPARFESHRSMTAAAVAAAAPRQPPAAAAAAAVVSTAVKRTECAGCARPSRLQSGGVGPVTCM